MIFTNLYADSFKVQVEIIKETYGLNRIPGVFNQLCRWFMEEGMAASTRGVFLPRLPLSYIDIKIVQPEITG